MQCYRKYLLIDRVVCKRVHFDNFHIQGPQNKKSDENESTFFEIVLSVECVDRIFRKLTFFFII